jgi:hypothetical protein
LTTRSGKLYEAYVLSLIAEELTTREGRTLVLVGGQYVTLKGAPGPINRQYPRIELRDRNGTVLAELWTDVEVLGLSYIDRSGLTPSGPIPPSAPAPQYGDYHELDLAIVEPGRSGRFLCGDLWLGVECKHTSYQKSLLRETLGVRREISLLSQPLRTRFATWPRASVPAHPASCLSVYCADTSVRSYSQPGSFFGIDFHYAPLP